MQLWKVIKNWIYPCIPFSFLRIVFQFSEFSSTPSWCINLLLKEFLFSLIFAVNRINWCFEPLGAGGTRAATCCSSIGWHTSDTSSDKNYVSEHLQRVRSKRTCKMKKVWAQGMLVGFLWRGPQVLRQGWANLTVGSVVKTSLFIIMETMRVCGTSKAASIFFATNVWGWRRQAGSCSTLRGTPWVLQKQSDSGRRSWGLLWSWETGSTFLLKTSLLTRLVLWTPTLQLWPKFLPPLKLCVWVEDMNRYTSCGCSLLCLLFWSIWM